MVPSIYWTPNMWQVLNTCSSNPYKLGPMIDLPYLWKVDRKWWRFLSPKQYKPLCSSAVGSFPLLHKQEKGYSLNLDPERAEAEPQSWNQTAPKCEIQTTTKNFIIISPEIWGLSYFSQVLWVDVFPLKYLALTLNASESDFIWK